MEDLQGYIYEHIPIIKANNFGITQESGGIVVSGNFAEHINHRNSVFGGSLSTALIIAAWAYVRQLAAEWNCGQAVIVIQTQEVKFLAPVTEDFCATPLLKTEQEKDKLKSMVLKFGKGRINIESAITHESGQEILAAFKGDFVIVSKTAN